jgi:hypothetical protein
MLTFLTGKENSLMEFVLMFRVTPSKTSLDKGLEKMLI